MKPITFKAVFSGLVTSLMISTTVIAKDDFPEVTEDGLHKLSNTNHSVVYAKDGVDLSIYNKVILVDATIAFKKNWQRDQNRSYSHNKVSAKDMERIKTGLAELFKEVFTEKLNEAGHEVVSEAAEDVLIVRPAIINLDINAPDTRSTGRGYTLVASAGEMTLYVELYDSVTSDLLVKAIDTRADRESSNFTWQTKSANRVAARKILRSWADALSGALAEANETATDSGSRDEN